MLFHDRGVYQKRPVRVAGDAPVEAPFQQGHSHLERIGVEGSVVVQEEQELWPDPAAKVAGTLDPNVEVGKGGLLVKGKGCIVGSKEAGDGGKGGLKMDPKGPHITKKPSPCHEEGQTFQRMITNLHGAARSIRPDSSIS